MKTGGDENDENVVGDGFGTPMPAEPSCPMPDGPMTPALDVPMLPTPDDVIVPIPERVEVFELLPIATNAGGVNVRGGAGVTLGGAPTDGADGSSLSEFNWIQFGTPGGMYPGIVMLLWH